jgi:AbiV family abortive infection protein
MCLSLQLALDIAAKSHFNAESLLEDAQVLFRNERWPRVIFMCLIAQEELAKSVLSLAAAAKIRLGEFDALTERKYRRNFRDHKVKSATLDAVFDYFFTTRTSQEIVTKLANPDSSSRDQEMVKLSALYADFDGNVARSPEDVLPAEPKVASVLRFTTDLFVIAAANLPLLYSEIETVTWINVECG